MEAIMKLGLRYNKSQVDSDQSKPSEEKSTVNAAFTGPATRAAPATSVLENFMVYYGESIGASADMKADRVAGI
jgi:hypothetical protein